MFCCLVKRNLLILRTDIFINKMVKISVKDTTVTVVQVNNADYICITDIARIKNPLEPKDVVKNWLRSKNTLLFLGLWEKLNNPEFKGVEFDSFMMEAGTNAFTMSPSRWIEQTNAIGIISRSGSKGGTFAHKDIAFEFSSWVSTEFKLYLLKEFQRLKEQEQLQLGWSAKRELAKINYRIHTDAIQQNLIPIELTQQQISIVYANEADVLNVALFGLTAKQWRDSNPNFKGNIRDYATINELICLSNMENLNAVFINEGQSQKERLLKLNRIAIQQMKVLQDVENRKMLK
ncbi:KilA, N-terminal/APSES-type HTH, DNA-binding protein [Paludibacter propionicigenes WB4]|uniref:KilA, N-terminal/APSES-type HTH, DNA-binding protein n=2 Tax=Paludibacter TaxID=346096 RepID=E4T7M9_PALPW|nr:KilA, N-terminal/APSES-type HTH, DNA-binding protein [Paludibacter propionicigenes WB4]